MSSDILKALEESICKWDLVCQGVEIDRGFINCALCSMFRDGGCTDCPIKGATMERYCKTTPYREYIRAWYDLYEEERPSVHYFLCELAEKELLFLLNLLPNEHSWREQL